MFAISFFHKLANKVEAIFLQEINKTFLKIKLNYCNNDLKEITITISKYIIFCRDISMILTQALYLYLHSSEHVYVCMYIVHVYEF